MQHDAILVQAYPYFLHAGRGSPDLLLIHANCAQAHLFRTITSHITWIACRYEVSVQAIKAC